MLSDGVRVARPLKQWCWEPSEPFLRQESEVDEDMVGVESRSLEPHEQQLGGFDFRMVFRFLGRVLFE